MKINILLLLSTICFGQEWQKVDSIKLSGSPTAYASDFQGNLYFGFSDGRLAKHDPTGSLLENFSFNNNSAISLIDVQNNLKPFLFYFDNQQITILDRFSSVPKDYLLSDFNLEIGMISCPAPDGDFWVVENNPQRLKKINPLRKITVAEVQVSLGDTINRMQAYQNILVISSTKNLHILDQFGGLIRTLNFDSPIDFQIAMGTLYCFTDTEIHLIDPFNVNISSTVQKPSNGGMMLKSQDGFLTINEDKVTFLKANQP